MADAGDQEAVTWRVNSPAAAPGLQVSRPGLKMQALLLMGCVALRESQDFSEPRLPHL